MLNKIKHFFKNLGPGLVTGAADDDPSGIATYAQTGAIFGYSQLWTALFSFPFMTAIQEMCARIGLVTGKGLAGVIRHHYSKSILYFTVLLLFLANTVNIGANLGAMASSAQLLINLPFVVWLILFAAITLILLVSLHYESYARVLKYLAFTLFAYIITVFVVNQDWAQVLKSTVSPTFIMNKNYLLNIVAILGTTISPYLFFWQASEEVEEEVEEHKLQAVDRGTPKISIRDISGMRSDTVIGMFISNLIMFFIIMTTASTLYSNGIFEINTAADAAKALKPIAGDFAFLLFAGGIVGTGLLSLPILAGSASYAVSETFGWKAGLSRKFSDAKGFYSVIILSTFLGLFVNFTPFPPFKLLYYTAVLNGICAPILMIVIMFVANDKKIMGKYTNNLFSNLLVVVMILIMTIAAVGLLLSFL